MFFLHSILDELQWLNNWEDAIYHKEMVSVGYV